MSVKVVSIPEVGEVRLIKSSRNRSIKLSVSDGAVRVSLPAWMPYAAATAFAHQHLEWIQREQQKQGNKQVLREGHKIGKLHTLHFQAAPSTAKLRSRVSPTKLIIFHHANQSHSDPDVQKRAETAAIRALTREAEVLLPPRLQQIAIKHGLNYRSLKVKRLKRRWGSCDPQGAITLNCYLMQLSWQQIDYVICHELAHTRHMNHGQAFWQEVEHMLPDAKMIAKKVRHTQPMLIPRETSDMFEDDMAY